MERYMGETAMKKEITKIDLRSYLRNRLERLSERVLDANEDLFSKEATKQDRDFELYIDNRLRNGAKFIPENDNPVEFLYLDRQRISSLIGQLSDRGVLTGLKEVVSKTRNREEQGKVALPGVVDFSGRRSRSSAESSEETYDTFWTHAFSFLRDLEANYAVPVEKSRMGSLVKFEALLQFLDMRFMQGLWDHIAEAYTQSQGQATVTTTRKGRHEAKRQAKQEISPEMKLGVAMMKQMPHLFHMTFLTTSDQTFRFWAAMKPEYLTINSEDLAMKYGAVMDGVWTVVGIVDARIGEPPKPLPLSNVLDHATNAMSLVRGFLGRPEDHWGLTPIAIYTPMRGIAETEAENHTDR